MAKKKKLNKLKVKKLLKSKRLLKLLPLGLLVLGVLVGLLIAWLQPPDQHPRSLVWAADDKVTVPADLYEFLKNRQDCQGYRGTSSPEGVALWGVYQVDQAKFAKIAYGCSTDMSYYIVAIKEQGRWSLIQPVEYFANNLPHCSMVDRYKLPKTFESFCRAPGGTARENHNK